MRRKTELISEGSGESEYITASDKVIHLECKEKAGNSDA
jgi:hypothetical protein